jgi:hypothetical protein
VTQIRLVGAHNVRDLDGLPAPSSSATSTPVRSLPMAQCTSAGVPPGSTRLWRAASFEAGVDPNLIIADGYVELLELGAPAFAAALQSLVEPGGTPALVHCAIGKDRTGVLVALLLGAAGVEREAIVADYALSHHAVRQIREQLEESEAFRALARHVPAFVFDATPETMELFLRKLDERWGGAAGYFAASGVDPAVIERWKELLLRPEHNSNDS